MRLTYYDRKDWEEVRVEAGEDIATELVIETRTGESVRITERAGALFFEGTARLIRD